MVKKKSMKNLIKRFKTVNQLENLKNYQNIKRIFKLQVHLKLQKTTSR